MPPNRNLERLIGTAIVDREFQSFLLRAPLSAAQGFDLSSDELDVLKCAGTETIEELAAHVHARITKAPGPRRALPSRWATEDNQLARVAV